MNRATFLSSHLQLALVLLVASVHQVAFAQAVEPVLALVKKETPAVLDTMKSLVEIESGSSDIEGLDRIRELIAGRLSALGGPAGL